MTKDDSWMKDATCGKADIDPEIFFLVKNKQSENIMKIRLAKALCHQCPVRQTCLSYSIAHNIRSGIWGGMTVHERQQYFPKAVREKIKVWWFRNHPGAKPMLTMGRYTKRVRRGGGESKQDTDDYTMSLSR